MRMKKVAAGQLFDGAWAEKPELNPFLQALVELKFHFENLNTVANVNLAMELHKVFKLVSSC